MMGLRLSRRLLVSAALAAALAGVSPDGADVAHLRNGRTLAVSGYRIDGDRVVLLMEGGGEIAVPNGQVLTIQRDAPETPGAGRAPSASGPPDHRLVAPSGPVLMTGAPAPGEGVLPILIPAGAVPDREVLREVAARIARKYRVDVRLVLAVIEVESRYDAFAVSPRGALGLMQLMPGTLARFDVKNPYDPVQNIDGGVRYLKELLERYSGQKRLALAAYNAGEEAVEHFSGIPPYRETILYVDRVLRALAR